MPGVRVTSLRPKNAVHRPSERKVCGPRFFHRGLYPLCGEDFLRYSSENFLFTPTEVQAADALRPAAGYDGTGIFFVPTRQGPGVNSRSGPFLFSPNAARALRTATSTDRRARQGPGAKSRSGPFPFPSNAAPRDRSGRSFLSGQDVSRFLFTYSSPPSPRRMWAVHRLPPWANRDTIVFKVSTY